MVAKRIEQETLIDAKTVEMMTGLKSKYQEKARQVLGLPHYKIGSRVYYKLSEVWLWIEQRKVTR